jgi:hypothetical protein
MTNTPIPTVKELRQSGYKIRIQRYRPYVVNNSVVLLDDENARMNCFDKSETFQKGGVTIVAIRKPTGEEVRGEAVCSFTDPFVKKLGVEIAIAKALELPIPNI